MALTERPTQSLMMKTCHVLYREGARQLLKETVWLFEEAALVSFILFMQADPPIRFPLLRDFKLELREGISMSTADMLTDLFVGLARAGNIGLRYLCLFKSEDMLLTDRKLAGAIASLTTLTSVSMFGIGSRGSRLLKTLRSRLTEADLEFSRDMSITTSTRVKDMDPTRLAKYSKDTLGSLRIHGGCIADTPTITVYPRMESLEVEGPWVPYAPVLLRASPSLSQLGSFYGDSAVPLEHGMASLQAANRAYQVEHGSWQAMGYFAGPAQNLYLLSPLCHIRRINLDHYRGDDDVDADMLCAVLSDARPVDLQFAVFLSPGDNFLNPQWMAAAQS